MGCSDKVIEDNQLTQVDLVVTTKRSRNETFSFEISERHFKKRLCNITGLRAKG